MRMKTVRMKNNFGITPTVDDDIFLFVDGNTIYSSNGGYMKITKDDLKEAKKRSVTLDQIKILIYRNLSHGQNEF